MATTAATPLATAQSLLNDPSGLSYTNAKLIPLMQKAYRELQMKMRKSNLSPAKEVSASITVSAGTVRLADGAGLPLDFLLPVTLYERGSTSEHWAEMTKADWEENRDQTNVLSVWAWREEEIKFVGATDDRLVLLRYIKGLTAITGTSTALQVNGCEDWLASRCAAIAALVIGENPTRATSLNEDAGMQWDDLKGVLVKDKQAIPVRRRVNRYRR